MFNSKQLEQIQKETGKSYSKINRSDRAKELENAVSDYLKLNKIPFMRVDNYRCFKCGQVQNKKASGWPDFYCYKFKPHLAIECKTGAGKLTPEQIEVKDDLESSGDAYILLHDNIDKLIEFIRGKEKEEA